MLWKSIYSLFLEYVNVLQCLRIINMVCQWSIYIFYFKTNIIFTFSNDWSCSIPKTVNYKFQLCKRTSINAKNTLWDPAKENRSNTTADISRNMPEKYKRPPVRVTPEVPFSPPKEINPKVPFPLFSVSKILRLACCIAAVFSPIERDKICI